MATMNTPRRRAGDTAADAAAAVENSLKKLIQKNLEQNEWKDLLKALGNGKANTKRRGENTTRRHESFAMKFNEVRDAVDSDDTILKGLLEQPESLEDLLAQGTEGQTILHVILDPNAYSPGEFDFDRLKPFIRFLLRLQPELPLVTDIHRKTPLFAVLSSFKAADSEPQDLVFDGPTKERIVRYFCDECSKGNPDGLGSPKAIESLAVMVNPSDNTIGRHTIHMAIENDLSISENVVKRLRSIPAKTSNKSEKTLCLEKPDGNGKTCLHVALTRPFTSAKISWAQMLAKLQPNLLMSTYKSDSGNKETLTPLQHFTKQRTLQHLTEQRNKDKQEGKKGDNAKSSREIGCLDPRLDSLEDFLKQQCLAEFDNSVCTSIMYTKDNVREIYLTFEKDEVVSGPWLQRQSQHYKLDTTLRSVHIPKIKVDWDDRMKLNRIAKDWGCIGNIDLYLIFEWLKHSGPVKVKKVLEVVVDDFESDERKPHSDKAIVECLKGLQVETWDWRRMDVSSDVIFDAAGENVKIVCLYCSGLRAVLQSWSSRGGLARLKNLEKVYLEAHQGLESIETMTNYVDKFKSDLKDTFQDVNGGRLIEVNSELVKAAQKKNPGNESAASKIKNENEQGFQEQDWLKCMDEFADIISLMDKEDTVPVKVALIDDGVKSSFADLDDDIARGKSFVQQPKSNQRKATLGISQNYNTSQLGHGTVMAYYIRRVCPRVRLCVAKLDPQGVTSASDKQVTFTIESVAEAIKWAVEEQQVDIISMSWSIDEKGSDDDTKRVDALREAITLAARKKILLFCANPDKGPGNPQNNTYPKKLDSRVFCIGAATQDSKRWSYIDDGDNSCDYFLPGVDLGIPVESNQRSSKKNLAEPPDWWHQYSGSSLSCALAAGLAAMILHCALVSGVSVTDPEWKWLKSHLGMRAAFKSIETQNKWLHVRGVFGDPALRDRKKKLLRELVDKTFCAGMPRGGQTASQPEPASEPASEPEPGRLTRQSTLKEDD